MSASTKMASVAGNKSLPVTPSLEHLRKQAKELLTAYQGGDTNALVRVHVYLPQPKQPLRLTNVQFVLAREYGFASWPRLKHYVEQVNAAHAALLAGDTQTLSDLLRSTPSLSQARVGHMGEQVGFTLLHHAAMPDTPGFRIDNQTEIAKTLLASGADVNARPADGHETPLHWAASVDNTELATLFLEAGADINATGSVVENGNPLDNAVHFGCPHVAELLVERGATLNHRTAAGTGRTNVLQTLLQRTDEPTRKQWSEEALAYAAMNGHTGTITALLDGGVNINATVVDAHSKRTALHWAVYRNHLLVVALLLDRGANTTIKDERYNATPWGWANYFNNEPMKQYLESRIS